VRTELEGISTTTRDYRDQARTAASDAQGVVDDATGAVRDEFAGYVSDAQTARDQAQGHAQSAADAAAAEVGKKADKSYVDSRKAVWLHHGGVFEVDPNAAEGDVVFDLSTNKIHEIIDGMI